MLALGPDRGEYLFGVRDRELRAALLELINNEQQTIRGLCEAHMLDPHLLSAVLHHASQLFRPDDLQRWGSVFVRGEPDRDDLEVSSPLTTSVLRVKNVETSSPRPPRGEREEKLQVFGGVFMTALEMGYIAHEFRVRISSFAF